MCVVSVTHHHSVRSKRKELKIWLGNLALTQRRGSIRAKLFALHLPETTWFKSPVLTLPSEYASKITGHNPRLTGTPGACRKFPTSVSPPTFLFHDCLPSANSYMLLPALRYSRGLEWDHPRSLPQREFFSQARPLWSQTSLSSYVHPLTCTEGYGNRPDRFFNLGSGKLLLLALQACAICPGILQT